MTDLSPVEELRIAARVYAGALKAYGDRDGGIAHHAAGMAKLGELERAQQRLERAARVYASECNTAQLRIGPTETITIDVSPEVIIENEHGVRCPATLYPEPARGGVMDCRIVIRAPEPLPVHLKHSMSMTADGRIDWCEILSDEDLEEFRQFADDFLDSVSTGESDDFPDDCRMTIADVLVIVTELQARRREASTDPSALASLPPGPYPTTNAEISAAIGHEFDSSWLQPDTEMTVLHEGLVMVWYGQLWNPKTFTLSNGDQVTIAIDHHLELRGTTDEIEDQLRAMAVPKP